jgi:hypothetical protein
MGTRIQNLANNFTTAGIVKAAAINDASVSGITSIPAGLGGAFTLLSTQTASASASIEFTSGIDSTYSSYVFKFINCRPQNDARGFYVNFSTDGGSNYNVTKTTTCFLARQRETGTPADLAYKTGEDLAQSTADQILNQEIGNGADECVSGNMQLFNPSSTTYVKHFISRTNGYEGNFDYTFDWHTAGYCNTTSAINAVIFRFNSSNIDDGIIKMYGVS